MSERPTELRHPSSTGLHAASGEDALARLLDAQVAAIAAVRSAIPSIEAAAQAGAGVLRAGGRMGYAGAGSSGTMALADALELAGTFGIPPERTPVLLAGGTATLLHMTGAVEDDPSIAQADFDRAAFSPGDVLICVSASGGTPYTLAVGERARAAGVTVVGMANVPSSPLLELSDIPILLDTGPEVVSGSTRMGAGTSAKVALNMLSTRVGLLLGHVHDGYMVNLTADNSKLIDRAGRIVAAIAGTDLETARAALARTGGAVKAAILVAQGQSPEGAEATLKRNQGHLRNVRSFNDPETNFDDNRETRKKP